MIHKTQAELHQMTYDQRQAYYTEKEFDSQQRQKEINKRLAPDLSADERELAVVRENLERHKKRGVKDSPFTKKERQLVEKIEHDRQLASRLAEPDNVVFVEFAGEKLAKLGDAGATPAELDRLNLQFEVWHKDPSSRQSDAMIAEISKVEVDLDHRNRAALEEQQAELASSQAALAEQQEKIEALKSKVDGMAGNTPTDNTPTDNTPSHPA